MFRAEGSGSCWRTRRIRVGGGRVLGLRVTGVIGPIHVADFDGVVVGRGVSGVEWFREGGEVVRLES